jgi:hypothetical protein
LAVARRRIAARYDGALASGGNGTAYFRDLDGAKPRGFRAD